MIWIRVNNHVGQGQRSHGSSLKVDLWSEIWSRSHLLLVLRKDHATLNMCYTDHMFSTFGRFPFREGGGGLREIVMTFHV